jgi:GYF domain 2
METNYTMIGADGLQYGPINLGQVQTWIAEGRITAETKILRSDNNAWLPASQYAEFGLAQSRLQAVGPAVAVASPVQTTVTMADLALERRARVGARWFFWIAGLSLINSFIAMSGKSVVFVVGLGVTKLVDMTVLQMGVDKMIALVINLIISGLFILFGVFAMKRQSWSFIVGMIFYALDAVLAFLVSSWLGLGFHVFVLFWVYQGLQASIQLKSQNR